MNTKSKGSISEAKVLAKVLELGKTAFLPFGENTGVDLIVQDDNNLIRIQTKTGRKVNNSIEFDGKSTYKIKGQQVSKDYEGKIDYFAIYYPANDKVYFVPLHLARGKSKIYLSFSASKRHPDVKLAENFEQWKVN
jgi:hypothetical protein